MTQPTASACPHLGLNADRTLARSEPDEWHRCYAQRPPAVPDEPRQRSFCLTAGHTGCPFYVAPAPAEAIRPHERSAASRIGWLPWAVVAALLLAVLAVYARDMFTPASSARPAAAAGATSPAGLALLVAATTTPPSSAAAAGADPPNGASRSPTRLTTPTAERGGKVVGLAPRAGQAGWWSSSEAHGNHLGDSFLYAGHQGDRWFISAVQFDLRSVPRGAPIREASLTLTGLQADRFAPDAGGTWSVQLLAPGALADPARADFQALLSAPISVTLVPQLVPADLAAGQANGWALDASAREWLSQQILAGVTSVVARITGPSGGRDTLFGWDSGAGPESGGNGPQLTLSLGPAPATPPPLPTGVVVVATITPTPANVMTAAANALTATAAAPTAGTVTAAPAKIVTPTPIPGDVATAQAAALLAGGPPIVIYTPVPKNSATATANSVYATAVAVTTGTFTPVPTNAVTPVIVLPTPIPDNPATAMVQMLAATAQAARHGPNTPLPFGVLVATTTPTPPVVAPTATPGNLLTAQAYALEATAVAATTGTFTPTPPDAMTPTSPPTETPIPLVVDITAAPTSTPTSTPPGEVPASLRGKILFFSDRTGGHAPSLYALDPATGALMWITQLWPFAAALKREAVASDGKKMALVDMVTTSHTDKTTRLTIEIHTAQLFTLDQEFNVKRQLTHTNRYSYDPVWSPKGDWIAFVNQDSGNDDIYLIRPDGSETRRLTNGTWEWNKHPSWSPDGSKIVFWSNRVTGRKQLWIMNADGSEQQPLMPSGSNDWDPIWVK